MKILNPFEDVGILSDYERLGKTKKALFLIITGTLFNTLSIQIQRGLGNSLYTSYSIPTVMLMYFLSSILILVPWILTQYIARFGASEEESRIRDIMTSKVWLVSVLIYPICDIFVYLTRNLIKSNPNYSLYLSLISIEIVILQQLFKNRTQIDSKTKIILTALAFTFTSFLTIMVYGLVSTFAHFRAVP